MGSFSIENFDEFFKAILKLKSVEDCRKFFEDVCTIKEMQDVTQRLEVASLLMQGNNYQDVSKKTGASTATISRVNKCLMYGNGGYKLVIAENTDKADK